MPRRTLIAALFVALLGACLAVPAAAAAAGPRLAFVRFGVGSTELLTANAAGGERVSLYRSSLDEYPFVFPFSRVAWAPDGSRLAFVAGVGQRNGRLFSYPETAIGLVAAEGGGAEILAGTKEGSEPVFAPDGRNLAYARSRLRYRPNHQGGVVAAFSGASIWLADLATGERRQLTPWRNGVEESPSSFSPDGSLLAFTRERHGRPRAMALSLATGAGFGLVDDAAEPVYSPDGSRIAFLRGPRRVTRSHRGNHTNVMIWRETDLFTIAADGSDLRRLTRTRRTIETEPRWDPSGQRLAYTVLGPFGAGFAVSPGGSAVLGVSAEIDEVNADGTCARAVASEPRVAFSGPAWQPGTGREAPPISC